MKDEVINEMFSEMKFNSDGLIPAIAQEHTSGEVLMMAWMNEASIRATLKEGYAIYWSRSRQKLWRKGETSGHLSELVSFRYDCDGDTILMLVNQTGPACHTQRPNCFYKELSEDGVKIISDPINTKSPK